jgi:DNA-binding response OmpR family regulator
MRRDLPMIVLTAQPTIESAVAAVKADVVDYMLKPYKIEDLLLAISRALEERAQQLRQQQLLEMVGEAMELLRRTDTSAEKAALPSITASQNQTTNIGDVSGQATVTHLDPPNGRTATTATRAQPLDLKRGTGADAPHGYGTEYEAQGESAFKGASSVHLLHAGPLALDRQKRLVTVSTDPVRTVELTESEVSILLTLMQKPNQVFSYNQLAKSALGYEGMDKWTVESVIRSSVFRLRQKIEPGPDAPRLICTVRGRGYYFSPSGAKAN